MRSDCSTQYPETFRKRHHTNRPREGRDKNPIKYKSTGHRRRVLEILSRSNCNMTNTVAKTSKGPLKRFGNVTAACREI